MSHISPLNCTPAVWRRFLGKVTQDGDCWLWTGCTDHSGYGVFFVLGRGPVRAHRFSFEESSGPIPQGFVVDHLCSVRACVNPDHLEAVTVAENNRRRGASVVACPKGHPYSPDNTYVNPVGSKSCRECKRNRDRSRRGSVPRIRKEHQMDSAFSIDVKEASSRSSFSEYEIRSAINAGELPHIRRGRRIAILVDDFDKWLRSMRIADAS